MTCDALRDPSEIIGTVKLALEAGRDGLRNRDGPASGVVELVPKLTHSMDALCDPRFDQE